jgi:hypothetical protein
VSFTGRSKPANRCGRRLRRAAVHAFERSLDGLRLRSEDASKTKRATGEINWSLGTYIPVPQIEKAFSVSGLPRPSKSRRISRTSIGGFTNTGSLSSDRTRGGISHVRRLAFDKEVFSKP